MKNLMIALVVGFLGLSGMAAAAKADTQLIERHSYGYNFDGAVYRFNADQGSAWMVVNLSEYNDNADLPVPHGPTVYHESHLASVKGLSFDAAASQILFVTEAGSKIVCATVVEKNGVFGRKWLINPTGACRTYEVRENHAMSVYFEAK
jgi:hypothetical protein